MRNSFLPEESIEPVNDKQIITQLPVAPSLSLPISMIKHGNQKANLDRRSIYIALISIGIGLVAGITAKLLSLLIGAITNLSYYGKLSFDFSSPANNQLSYFAVVVPVIGGLIVGVMARYGSAGIRGHGIPEAMEQILTNGSKIPPRLIFLKPLSAAISIGTGGPFGAEGPIISTGGAIGSFFGQLLHTSANERKTLLSAGAAAGMTATFGSPVSAIFLAIELLLFELKPASLIAVALACGCAESVRLALVGSEPMFPMGSVTSCNLTSLLVYCSVGLLVGLIAVWVTRLVYAIEDGFDKLPIHWACWPALGGVAVGLIGLISPDTLGVGYFNIAALVSGKLVGISALTLCMFKLISWSVALGSGTSGGTLAPLFTIGGGLGSFMGLAATKLIPHAGIDTRVAALVGMASMFASSSRAVLTSILFAFEVTHQFECILPLLMACMCAYTISSLLMRETIMTEKIARRGVSVPTIYTADYFDHMKVSEVATKTVVTLQTDMDVKEAKEWLAKQPDADLQNEYPVFDREELVGLVSWKDIFILAESKMSVREIMHGNTAVITENTTLREAADAMVKLKVSSLLVVSVAHPHCLTGIITRADLLSAHERKLTENLEVTRNISFTEK